MVANRASNVKLNDTQISILKRVAHLFPDKPPKLGQFSEIRTIREFENLVKLISYIPFRFACEWMDHIVNEIIPYLRQNRPASSSEYLSFGAITGIIREHVNFDVKQCSWARKMYRHLTCRIDEDIGFLPILAAYIGRLSETNMILECATLRLPHHFHPEESDADHEKQERTMMWLYAVQSLPSTEEESAPSTEKKWKPSSVFIMQIARLMDNQDLLVRRAAHAAMNKQSFW
jgi:hypothetical protein